MLVNNMDVSFWTLEFQKLYKKSLIKDHGSLGFLKAVRIFDPSQISFLSKDIEEYKKFLIELNSLNCPILHEFTTYLKANIVFDPNQGLIDFWKKSTQYFPNLSKLAIKCLNTPVTSVDVERSFSMYRDILTHKRCRLKESSIETLSMINYNFNFNDYSH